MLAVATSACVRQRLMHLGHRWRRDCKRGSISDSRTSSGQLRVDRGLVSSGTVEIARGSIRRVSLNGWQKFHKTADTKISSMLVSLVDGDLWRQGCQILP